jgi:hypothetical protein
MLDALKADLAKSVLKHSEGSNSLATMKKVKLAQWCIPIMAAAWKTGRRITGAQFKTA